MKHITLIFLSIAILALYGCASPVTRDQITPDLYDMEDKNISLTVIENRPYVLTGDKTEKFEGIIRSGFGIPMTIDRPKRPVEERLVDFLSNLIKEGFKDVGVEVSVLRAEKGETLATAIANIPSPRPNKSVVLVIDNSKWDAGGFKFRYLYSFDIYVIDSDGEIMVRETYHGDQADDPSETHTVFDMYTIIYREKLEAMFKSKIIKDALSLQHLN